MKLTEGSQRTVRRIRDVERAAITRWLVDERKRFADDVRAGTFKPGMSEAMDALGRLTAEEPEHADFMLVEDDAPIAVVRVERRPEIGVRFVFRPRTAPAGAGGALVASVVDAFISNEVTAVYAGKHSTLVGKHLLVRLRFMALSPAPGESFAWRLPAARWRAHRILAAPLGRRGSRMMSRAADERDPSTCPLPRSASTSQAQARARDVNP